MLGGGGGSFDVQVPDLLDGKTLLRADSVDVSAAAASAVDAGHLAAGAAGSGPLAQALESLAAHLKRQGNALADGAQDAGDTLGANAATYAADDAAAANVLSSPFAGAGDVSLAFGAS